MAKIIDSEPSVGPEAIELFQRVIDAKLPRPYLEFLLKYNGGYPEPSCLQIPGLNDSSLIQDFNKINSKETYDDLFSKLKVFSGRISKDLLPIASDGFGNQICIAIRGPKYGQIYFWDHENEVEEVDGLFSNNIYLVGASFDKFVSSLIDEP